MRLYHFLSKEYALQGISKRRLKISLIDDLNDPFELRSFASGDTILNRTHTGFSEALTRSYGLMCFSARWSNPVLWGHYGEKHKGICLGFDVSTDCVKKVKYVERRVILQGSPTEDQIRDLLYTKFSGWSYEEEWRGFIPLDERDPHNPKLFFKHFDSQVQLKEVILGLLCDVSEADIRVPVSTYEHHVAILRATLARTSFDIVAHQP